MTDTAEPASGVSIISVANTISSKQSLLIIPIVKFFNVPENLLYLIRVLNSEVFGTKSQQSGSPISLRLIDWFVTNYCKKNNIMYNLADYRRKNADASESSRIDASSSSFDNYFFVHDNYKSQLKECSKKHFDPFCRRNRVRFYYKPNAYFKTTVGQLNFFKWALENHVIDYIRENLDAIEKDMNDCIVIAPSEHRKIEKNTKKRTSSESGRLEEPSLVSRFAASGRLEEPSLVSRKAASGSSVVLSAPVGGLSASNADIEQSARSNVAKPLKTNTVGTMAVAQVNPIIAELAPKTKSQKKTSSRQKRKELSSSANKSFTKYSIPTTLTFD
jgi:hypothetical protein